MEINDRVLSNKILSEDRSSRHFKIILKNKSTVELWKVPKIAVYGVALFGAIQVLMAALWLAGIQLPGLPALFESKVQISKKISSPGFSKMLNKRSGSADVVDVGSSWKNSDLILTLTVTAPIQEGKLNQIKAELLDSEGQGMESKIQSLWRIKTASLGKENLSVIKILIPSSVLTNDRAQSISISALENKQSKLELSINLKQVRTEMKIDKKVTQAKNTSIRNQ
jgi:hypothetical protein